MKTAQRAILISLLLLFFFGNIGVNVFKHICKEDGVSISYVVNKGDEHCKNHEAQHDLPPCCQKDQEEDKDDCCDDEMYYFKLHVDAEQQALFHYNFNATQSDLPWIVYADVVEISTQCTQHAYNDPPPPDGRDILLRKQVWNI